MAVSLVRHDEDGIVMSRPAQAVSQGKSLSREEILATLSTCKCGEIYELYLECKDGKIRKRGVCPDCQAKMLEKARASRVPGAPRMTAAKRKRIEAESLKLREKIEATPQQCEPILESPPLAADSAPLDDVSEAEGHIQYRTCSQCFKEKPLDQFDKDCKREDGIRLYCRDCRKRYDAERYRHQEVKTKSKSSITLDLQSYPMLMEELKMLAFEDVRTIEQEAIWILMDYTKTVRDISEEVLDQARESMNSVKRTVQ